MLVVFTTVVCGSTVGVLQKCLFANVEKKVKDDDEDDCDECGHVALKSDEGDEDKE